MRQLRASSSICPGSAVRGNSDNRLWRRSRVEITAFAITRLPLASATPAARASAITTSTASCPSLISTPAASAASAKSSPSAPSPPDTASLSGSDSSASALPASSGSSARPASAMLGQGRPGAKLAGRQLFAGPGFGRRRQPARQARCRPVFPWPRRKPAPAPHRGRRATASGIGRRRPQRQPESARDRQRHLGHRIGIRRGEMAGMKFHGGEASAGAQGALQHDDFQTGIGKRCRRGQTVRACADDRRVVPHASYLILLESVHFRDSQDTRMRKGRKQYVSALG